MQMPDAEVPHFKKKKKVLSSGMVPAELCNHAFIPREGAVALF